MSTHASFRFSTVLKYLDRLDELIHGSETAKRALREKDGGILIDGQKKRISTDKDKDSLKKQKKILQDIIIILCANIARCCSVSAITREKNNKIVTLGPNNVSVSP